MGSEEGVRPVRLKVASGNDVDVGAACVTAYLSNTWKVYLW